LSRSLPMKRMSVGLLVKPTSLIWQRTLFMPLSYGERAPSGALFVPLF
jgi:hypothetical protein